MKEDPNNLRANTKARILDLLSEGEIGGLIDGPKSIYLNNTPLQNSDGTWNFTGVTYTERFGLPDQSPIPGFEFAFAEIPVGVEVKKAIPITRTVNGADVDSIVVKVGIPSLQYVDQKNSRIKGTSVDFMIELIDPSSAVVFSQQYNITGKTASEFQRGYYIKLPGDEIYLVRFTRLTADAEKQDLANSTVFASYTEINEDKFSYPDSAVIGIEIDAQQFGQGVPTRNYLIRGVKCQVPVNYDPVAHTYSGTWDGTWKWASTDDPAWILRELLVNDRFGLGETVPESAVDHWALYEISMYCNEPVSDGYGGFEPRFTWNAWIVNQSEAYEALSIISSAFRGMIYWKTGAVTAVQDSPEDPIIDVNETQVIDGVFSYEKSGKKARATVVYVSWTNPDDYYRIAVDVVEDFEGVAAYGWQRRDLSLVGCHSRSLAIRMARWVLYTEQTETETIRYECYADHLRVAPGRVIKVVDSKRLGFRAGGRIASVDSTTQLTLNEPFAFQSGAIYKITVIKADGSPEEILLNNPGITTATVTLTAAPSQAQLAGWPWTILSNDPNKWTVKRHGFLAGAPTSTQITLDAPYDFLPGQTYKVILDAPLGAKETIALVNPGVTATTVTLASAPSLAQAADKPFVLTVNDADKSLYRVLLVRELTDKPGVTTYEINGVVQNPNKHAEIEQDIKFDDTPALPVPSVNKVSPLFNLNIKETVEASATEIRRHLDLSWSPPILEKADPGDPDVLDPYVNGYVVYSELDDGGMTLLGDPSEPNFRIWDAIVGNYKLHVCAINSFGFRSPPFEATFTLNAIPYLGAAITGLQLVNGFNVTEFVGRDAKFSWRKSSDAVYYDLDEEPNGADSGAVDPMFKDYRVCVFDTNGNKLRQEFLLDPAFIYSYEKNYEDTGGSPVRDFVVVVQYRDRINGLGPASLIRVSNTAPELPTVEVDAQFQQVTLFYNLPVDPDFVGMLVWASTSPSVPMDEAHKVFEGSGTPIFTGTPGVTYYYRYAAYDVFGQTGLNISAEASVLLPLITVPDLDTTPPAVPTGLALTSSINTNPDGSQLVRLSVSWTGVADSDIDHYELAVQEAAGSFVDYATTGTAYDLFVKGNVAYTAKVRSVDRLSNRSAYTSTVSLTSTSDSSAPTAPTGLAITAGVTSLYLTWTNPTAADLDSVEVWENTVNNSATATKITTKSAVSGLLGSFSRVGLPTGTTRYYWLKARDTTGNVSAFTAVASATTTAIVAGDLDTVAPAVPTGLSLSSAVSTNPDGSQLVILTASWTGVADADLDHYEIALQEGAGSFVDSSTTGLSYQWIVKGSTVYTAKVLACDKLGNRSAYTSMVSLTSTADASAPSAPTALSASAAYGGVTLTWGNPVAADFAAVDIYENTVNVSGSATLIGSKSGISGAVDTFFRPNLGVGSTRYYWLKARDTTGNTSAFTSSVSAVIPVIPVTDLDTTAPAVPTGLGLSSAVTTNPDGSQLVRLTASWTGVADSDLDHYELAVQEGAGAFVDYSTTGLSFDLFVKGSTSYTAKVRAVDRLGNRSAYTSTVSLTSTADSSAPSAPTSLVAVAAYGLITLTWANPVAADFAAVDIYENTVNVSGSATLIGSKSGVSGAVDTFSRTGLATGSTRYYWLKARDTTGNLSAFSSSANATIPVIAVTDLDTTAPAVPTGLALSSTLSLDTDKTQIVKLVATWTANSESDLLGYEVELTEFAVATVYTAATNRYEWAVKGGAAFTARVRAVDRVGNKSAYSSATGSHSATTDTTPPSAPTGLTAAALFTGVWLTWTNPSDSDLAKIEIWENTTNTSGTATRIDTIDAKASSGGSFVRSGLGNSAQRYYWLKAVDTSGNASGFTASVNATTALLNGGSDIAAASITVDRFIAGMITSAYIQAGTIVSGNIAAGTITGTNIAAGTITATNILAGTITATEIAAATITGAKIAATTITAGNIVAGTITATEIAAATITGAKIAATTITASNIVAGTITATQIAAGTITATQIAAATITGANIAGTTITAANIQAGTITATEIAAATITGAKIAATTITASNIVAGTITATQIAAATITGSNIAATTITASNIVAGTITATQIAAGTITATQIAASTITGSNIAATTITATNIAAGTITATQIAAATITGSNIAAGTITATNILAGTITATEIAAATITGAKIAATTITATNIAAGTITATQIAAATITGSNIAATTITATNIAAGTITATQIASGTITATQIAAGTITATEIAAATITGANIAASTITAAKLNVTDLSAISANLGTISVGTANIADLSVTTLKINGDAVTTEKINSGAVIRITSSQGTNTVHPVSQGSNGHVLVKSLSFTVDSASSKLTITFSADWRAANANLVYLYMIISSIATPNWSGNRMTNAHKEGWIGKVNDLNCVATMVLDWSAGLSAGSHTIDVYCNSSGSGTHADNDIVWPFLQVTESKKPL